ncbi:hypothetical protein ACFL2V_07635 [Pseudomonadota bacterium]
MSSKQPSKRNVRKNIQRRFDSTVDLERLNYKKRAKPGKDIAKITGFAFAGIIYLLGFGLAYFSWNRGLIDVSFMNKMVWIFMIPSSVIGVFAFLITSNRREFPVREDIRAHITDFEGETGTFWRYAPILNQLKLKKIDMEGLIEASHEGRLIKMAPEDICETLRALDAALRDGGDATKGNILNEVEQNFASLEAAA